MLVSGATAQVGLVIDDQVIFPVSGGQSDLNAPAYVTAAGFASKNGQEAIEYNPSTGRLSMQTLYADLTCGYFDGNGNPVAPPSGLFTLQIDRIPIPVGGPDPNVDYLGQPILREFPLDVAGGASISQMFLTEGPLLDICSSLAGCDTPQGVHLRCREAGTLVFNGDFEPPVLNLLGSVTTSGSTAVVGADTMQFNYAIHNAGQLNAADLVMQFSLDALPAGVTLTSVTPSTGSYDQQTGLWTVGQLDAGNTATINFSFSTQPNGPHALNYCTAMTLASVTGNPVNPALADAGDCVQLVREVDLLTTAEEDPFNIDPVDLSAGNVSYRYFLSVENEGPSNASGLQLQLSLTLPSGVQLDSVSTLDGTYDPQTQVWTLGNLAAGASPRQLRVDVTVTTTTAAGTNVICAGLAPLAINEPLVNTGDDQAQECTSVTGP
ncbi:MAG: hypothetical protein Kow0020_05580 [Wenzhouxiangellaceae bacterium]